MAVGPVSGALIMIPNPVPRRPERRRVPSAAGAALVLCLLSGPAAAADGTPGTDPEMNRVQQEIAGGFARGEADRIARLLSPKMKTYVACRMLAEADGYYGADQLRLLLQRLFRGRTTTSFRVVQPAASRNDGQAVMQAVWTFRDYGAAAADIRLAFTLALDAGAWRLREIRDRT
jgi:hypothetical protein